MVAQMGFAAQTTYWSAVDLHKAVVTSICEALNRPIRELHPEIAAAVAAKTGLLVSGVAVDEHARVAIENEQIVRGKPVGGGQASCRDRSPGSCADG